MNPDLILFIVLGPSVCGRVVISVHSPALPAPLERSTSREPTVPELADIADALKARKFDLTPHFEIDP